MTIVQAINSEGKNNLHDYVRRLDKAIMIAVDDPIEKRATRCVSVTTRKDGHTVEVARVFIQSDKVISVEILLDAEE